MKLFLRALIIILLLSLTPLYAQHNPYLRKKSRNKPSAKLARQNRKEMKKQNRVARRQMRRSRKHTGYKKAR